MWRPKFVSPSKGKAKVPANLDEVNTILVTPSLPKGVLVESLVVGCIATMKFKHWDLANTVKFPHLMINALMEQSVEGRVTMLQPKESLWKVDKSRLVFLLSIPHILRPHITMLVINKFLYLVHEEILWVNKPIHIIAKHVHWVLHLPCKGRDPQETANRSGDVVMIENLRKKYKFMKGQRGYINDNISSNTIHITT